MKKVMLVDDEFFITEGLKSLIEWDEYGLEVHFTAQNGKEALEILEKNEIDIVVTDINMPIVTGLELVKKAKQLDSKARFIILSGYDEFSYAKKAIEYGVEYYILKPIDEDELKEALKKITISIEKGREKKYASLKRNNKILSILEGRKDVRSLLNIEDLKLDKDETAYIAATIVIENDNSELNFDVNELIRESSENKVEILYRSSGDIVLLNSWSGENIREKSIFYYNKIRKILSEKFNINVFIAIGKDVNNILDIKDSYKGSKKLKKYILTAGKNICLREDEVESIEYKKINFNKEVDEINKILIERKKEKLEIYINKLFEKDDLSPRNIYDLAVKIILLIDKTLDEFKVDKKYKKEGIVDTIVNLCNENTKENIKKFLVSELEEVIELMQDSNIIKYSPVVQQIITIVNDKYYEDLRLKELATQYNVNTSYLGQIFSKEVGSSFSDYLNKTKNTKAKELILETNMKINDVAKAVGYSDSSYFYRKFKQFFGVSPSTLRDIKNY